MRLSTEVKRAVRVVYPLLQDTNHNYKRHRTPHRECSGKIESKDTLAAEKEEGGQSDNPG